MSNADCPQSVYSLAQTKSKCQDLTGAAIEHPPSTWKPFSHCNYRDGKGWYCSRVWCRQHGLHQRKVILGRLLDARPTYPEQIVLSCRFNAVCWPEQVAKARQTFFQSLRDLGYDFGFIWTLHFVDWVPHLHAAIFLLDISIFKYIKKAWTEALQGIGIEQPSRRRVYRKPLRTWEGLLTYLLITHRPLRHNEYPPAWRGWRFWDCSRTLFPKKGETRPVLLDDMGQAKILATPPQTIQCTEPPLKGYNVYTNSENPDYDLFSLKQFWPNPSGQDGNDGVPA